MKRAAAIELTAPKTMAPAYAILVFRLRGPR